MLELNSIAVEPELAEKGVWAEYFRGRFLLARKGPKYQARLVELYNADKALIESGTEEGNLKSLEVFRQAFADTVLLDWENISRDGVPLPYTPEEGVKLISDPRMFELINFLEGYSATHTNYQVKVEEEVAQEVKDSAVS